MIGSTVPHEDDLHLITGYAGPSRQVRAWQQADRKKLKLGGRRGSLIELVLLLEELLFEHRILDGLRLLVE